MSKIVPLRDRVVIKQDEAEEKSVGGLYIPPNSQDKPQRGTVVAVGEGLLDSQGVLHKPVVKPGDKVVYAKYSGTVVEEGGEEFILIKDGDIYAVLSD